MFWVPPGIGRPVNRRAVAIGRATFQPERTVLTLPNAGRVTVEFSAAVQAPMFPVQIRPITTHAVVAQKIELFIERQRNVFGHKLPRSFLNLDPDLPSALISLLS